MSVVTFMSMTESERLFESFCTEVGWRFVVVPRGEAKTPDYDLYIRDTRIVAEVKEITRDPYDNPTPDYQDEFVTVRGKTKIIGDQIRHKIKKAMPQIRKRAKEGYPTLIIVYDLHDPTLRWNSEPHDFLAAMYGPPERIIGLDKPYQGRSPYVKGTKFGPGRKTTSTVNTSLSAMASLWRTYNGWLSMDVFHNVYAKNPLVPQLLASARVEQFTIDPKETTFHTWRPVSYDSIT
jgi:hypothetical protein